MNDHISRRDAAELMQSVLLRDKIMLFASSIKQMVIAKIEVFERKFTKSSANADQEGIAVLILRESRQVT